MKPRSLNILVKFVGHEGVQRSVHLFARNLDADDLPVMADAELPEPQRAHRVLAFFHDRKRFAGHLAPVFDAGRQARRCGLVPDAQAGATGERANFLFGKSRIEQRRDNMVRDRSFLAGTEVALVIQVDAVCDGVRTRAPRAVPPSA